MRELITENSIASKLRKSMADDLVPLESGTGDKLDFLNIPTQDNMQKKV